MIDDNSVVCLICFDTVKKENIIPTDCSHNYCKECWEHYLADKVNDGRVMKVKCPDPSCKRELAEQEIKQRIPAELHAKFDRFYVAAQNSLNPNARWCPTPGCEIVMIGSKKNPRLKCSKCGHELCFNCNEPWHGSRSCEDAADRMMSAYASSHTVKKCPNCNSRIERSEGCNHMTCSRCGYEFCWMCRGHYTRHHFAPYNIFGCPGLQSGDLAMIADDRCCGVNLRCCGVCGMVKRLFYRLALVVLFFLGLGIGLPLAIVCCPCICIYFVSGGFDFD